MDMQGLLIRLKRGIVDDRGIGTLEIILIVAVIVVIAIAFRKWILAWVQKLFDSSNEQLQEMNQDGLIVPDVE